MNSNPRIPFQLADDRRPLAGPGGKNLIVQVVVNVEHWRFDQPMPRKLLTAPHGVDAVPDVPNYAWAEYGMRMGMPRLLRALGERGLPVGCAINAGVIPAYPRLADKILQAGWEFIGHGLHQKSLNGEQREEALIEEALSIIRQFTGKPVAGWLGPGLRETEHTPDYLKKAGIVYVSDWVLDDLPTWMWTAHGPMIAMPYSLELNDSPLYAIQAHRSDEMLRRLLSSLPLLAEETRGTSRVLTIALHPHLMGVPHRLTYLIEMLDILLARDDVVFMSGSQIADWYEAVEPAAIPG
ncbi:MAG: polysaccharide deacetylase family protein [Mesorhizobium sp.]|nr:polysaccharide deacetylase family protein [Mesorhizobium sp.]